MSRCSDTATITNSRPTSFGSVVAIDFSHSSSCSGPDASLVELVDEGDELARPADETVESEDDEDIALVQVVKAGGKVRAIGGGARSVVLEDPLAVGAR